MESKRREKEAKRLYYKRLFLFNFLIGQPLQQDYKLLSKIEYKPLKISLKELLKWIEVAPKLTKAKIDLNHAKLNLRSTWKDLIPYPKIGLSGLRYGHAYGTQSGGTEAQFIGSSSPSNFDLKVSIDLTLPLVGENGLFNKFGVRAAEIKVESAKNKVKKARMEAQGEVIGQYNDLTAQEEAVQDLKEAIEHSSLLLDNVLKAYKKGKIKGAQVRDALIRSSSFKRQYKEALLAHLEGKMALAAAIGMENPFGDKGTEKSVKKEGLDES